MESKTKLLGHPIHPMLIVVPLGLFIGAVVADAVYLLQGNPTFAAVAYWNIAGGIIGGLLAAVFGLLDWSAIPNGTRAKRVGLLHAVTNAIVLALFAFAWFARNAGVDITPTPSIFLIEIAALGLGMVAAWLGGELVDRLGVGVDPGAHLDAPSSLSSQPARLRDTPTSPQHRQAS